MSELKYSVFPSFLLSRVKKRKFVVLDVSVCAHTLAPFLEFPLCWSVRNELLSDSRIGSEFACLVILTSQFPSQVRATVLTSKLPTNAGHHYLVINGWSGRLLLKDNNIHLEERTGLMCPSKGVNRRLGG